MHTQQMRVNGRGRTRPRPRRTQAERRAETRHKLIQAAVRLLHESGFARLTVADVAARAGLTTGAVQHHFRSIQDLLRAVVEEAVFPLLHTEVYKPEVMELTAHERVGRLVDAYWEKLYGHSDYLVMWELMFGTRGEEQLHELLKTMQKRFVAKGVDDLLRVFADIRLRQRSAFKLWTFITSQLRGLALLSLFEDRGVLRDNLVLLKEAAVHLLPASAPGPAKVRIAPKGSG